MPEGAGLDELRDRLYTSYATTHAGISGVESQAHGFRRDVLPHLPQDRCVRILDIGCGQGAYVRQLLSLGFEHSHGIDLSPEQVKIARESGLTQVTLGDYRNSLNVAEWDVVIATDFFEHLTRSEALQAMERVGRALRPTGLLILRVPNAGSPFSGILRYGDLTHETSFTARSLHQLGAAAGFAQIQVYPCAPPVHGVKSALRGGLWWIAGTLFKTALIAETGQLRGHIVTQNIVAVLHGAART